VAGGTSEGSGEEGAALKGGGRRSVAGERPRGIAGGGERWRAAAGAGNAARSSPPVSAELQREGTGFACFFS
jgi:hypothetical protein